jgi:NAD(P)-dependent dehydrogenase (short-subunit alcohol dehydrogenase family)
LEYNPFTPRRYAPTVQFAVESLSSLAWNECPVCVEYTAKAGTTVDRRLAEETSNVPLRKYGTPDEVAVAVEGLLSAFSDHMTGIDVLHDGGFTRAY